MEPEQTPGQEAERKAFVAAVHAYYFDFDNAMEVAFDTEMGEELGFALWQAGKEYGEEAPCLCCQPECVFLCRCGGAGVERKDTAPAAPEEKR
jgi:hypothetical protein